MEINNKNKENIFFICVIVNKRRFFFNTILSDKKYIYPKYTATQIIFLIYS